MLSGRALGLGFLSLNTFTPKFHSGLRKSLVIARSRGIGQLQGVEPAEHRCYRVSWPGLLHMSKPSCSSFFWLEILPYRCTLGLWIFSCLYAFPYMLPSAQSYPFLHVKEKLVLRCAPISFTSLRFFEPYFLFLFYHSSFLSLSGTQSFRQRLICWVLSGRCRPPPPDSFGGGCACLLLCFCYILWALLKVVKPVQGEGSRTAPETLEAVCQNESKLCFNTQTVLPNWA